MDQLIAFFLAHQVTLIPAGVALGASLMHAKAGQRSLVARSLSLALPGFLNAPLFKALAVDVAKAVLAAWGTDAEGAVKATGVGKSPTDLGG